MGELRDSHILPEFIYKPMYDDKHRFEVIHPDQAPQKMQKGLRERLLCGNCEGQLAKYEKYVKEFIYDGKNGSGEWHENLLVLHGLDYKTIRLYYLSLLWRMSISTIKPFNVVDLGQRYEERIRNMILTETPGEPEEFGFFCAIPLIDGKSSFDWMISPSWARNGGHRYYRIVIGGILCIFTTNPASIPVESRGVLIQKDGSWHILAEDVRKIPCVYGFLNSVDWKALMPSLAPE